MENPAILLATGILIGVLLTAKAIKGVITTLPPIAYAYILFGLILFASTIALQGLGMAVVLITYALYQVMGRRAQGLANLLHRIQQYLAPWYPKTKATMEPPAEKRDLHRDEGPTKEQVQGPLNP